MQILLLDRRRCGRHVFAAMVLCSCGNKSSSPTEVPLAVSLGESVPVNRAAKCRFEGPFKRDAHTCSLPVSLPCTAAHHGQPSQMPWKNDGPFAYC